MPEPGAGKALVKVHYYAICDTDACQALPILARLCINRDMRLKRCITSIIH
ncbi:MAG TPA: hypothetical protein VKM55_12225 [Candidatus Lokiarchaeia archaeon]|nr:hypothetical protein [Candidatus Lokiarchaeia archaeon]